MGKGPQSERGQRGSGNTVTFSDFMCMLQSFDYKFSCAASVDPKLKLPRLFDRQTRSIVVLGKSWTGLVFLPNSRERSLLDCFEFLITDEVNGLQRFEFSVEGNYLGNYIYGYEEGEYPPVFSPAEASVHLRFNIDRLRAVRCDGEL